MRRNAGRSAEGEEFDAYLRCGILEYGFVQLACRECGHEMVVGFSERAVQATIDGVRVRVIALEDLIANKLAAGRPQDLEDV